MTAIQQQQYLQLPFVPGNSIVSQFIGPLCGDPVGTGNVLPRELCEFWKQKESSVTLVPAWCTRYGHASPGKVTPELPMPRAMAVPILLCCRSGTIPPSPLLTHLRDRWDEAPKTATARSNHNLWGQSKRGGHQNLRATTKAQKLESATFQNGTKEHLNAHRLSVERWMCPWKGCTHRNCTPGQLNTWSYHHELLLKITWRMHIPASPVILYCQWKLFQIFKWVFVSGLFRPWYKYLKNFKNKSSKLQKLELFNYKDNFVLPAAQSAGSSKATPPPPRTPAISKSSQKHCQEFY